METRAVLRREKRRDQANDWHGNSRQETCSPVPASNTHVIAVETESDASGRSSGPYFPKKNEAGTTGKRLKTESSVSGESFSDGEYLLYKSTLYIASGCISVLHIPTII